MNSRTEKIDFRADIDPTKAVTEVEHCKMKCLKIFLHSDGRVGFLWFPPDDPEEEYKPISFSNEEFQWLIRQAEEFKTKYNRKNTIKEE